MENSNEIVVLGEHIKTVIEHIDIYRLTFWKENPRVHSALAREYGTVEVSDLEIEELMWKEDHVKDLFQDIKKQGGLIDEILVKGNIVLEGNSRLCVYRKLHKKSIEQNDGEGIEKWSKIRARIIPQDTNDSIIFAILGTWHIKGKKQWDTFEKAAYLKRMNSEYGYSYEKIGEMISESKTFVLNNINAHDLMVENKIYDLYKFSYFLEMVKNSKISKLIGEEPKVQELVIKAISNNQFTRAEEVRDLPKVLNDKVAKREFFDEEVPFKDAFEITKDRHPEYDNAFYNQIIRTTKILKECPMTRIEEIKEDPKKLYYVKMLMKSTVKLCKKVGIE